MSFTRSYLYCWDFDKAKRPYTLSDSSKLTVDKFQTVTLKPVRQSVFLPGRGAYLYSDDDDLFVRTGAFAPTAKTEWGFIEPHTEEPVDEEGGTPTTIQYRIHDGTDSLYWDGGAWAVAGVGDWNTLADVNANLAAYTGASLAIEVNLKTTDGLFTPRVGSIGLKWAGKQLSYFREWIYDVLIASLSDNIRPLSDLTLESDGSDAIALADFRLDADFDITEIVCVFDHDADPGHDVDLFDSYDSANKVINLSGAVSVGNALFVTFKYRPLVAVTTSSDYPVENRVPSIVVSAIEPTSRKWLGARGPSVIDRTLPIPAGTVYPSPIPLRDIDFSIATHAPTSLDLAKLNEALSVWVDSHPTLRSKALDLSLRLQRGPLFGWSTSQSNANDLRGPAVGSFTLKNVPDFGNPHVANAAGDATLPTGPVDAGDPNNPGVGYGVKTLNLDFGQSDGAGTGQVQVTK